MRTSASSTATSVFHDPENAGHAIVNFAVDDVDGAGRTLRARGIAHGEVNEESQFVRIVPVADPDGNTIILLERR